MRPSDIFDAVHLRVREYQALAARITAIRADACAKDGPPRVGNAMAEYVADFHLAGKRVLARRWPHRWRLFRACFVKGATFEAHAKAERVSAATARYWAQEVRKVVGPELAKRGLFPPRQYRERNKTHAAEN